MNNKLFAVNQLPSSLTLKGGYLDIEPFGYAEITSVDVNEHTIVYALGRKWIEIVDKEPTPSAKRAGPTLDVTAPYEGMTEEELKEELKKEVKSEPATGTALGQNSTVEVHPEAEVKEATKKSSKAK